MVGTVSSRHWLVLALLQLACAPAKTLQFQSIRDTVAEPMSSALQSQVSLVTYHEREKCVCSDLY
jgi:hypothetical protein